MKKYDKVIITHQTEDIRFINSGIIHDIEGDSIYVILDSGVGISFGLDDPDFKVKVQDEDN